MQGIDIVNKTAFVANSDAVFADENKFGMRDLKLLAIRRANCKWTETATAHPLFQLLNIHHLNLNQPSAGVKTIASEKSGCVRENQGSFFQKK
jgi:hypothetical protein